MFDLNGEVIGINSMIYSRTGGYMGVSFAIPIDVAMDVANQLQSNGKVTRGRLGVQIQQLSQELAKSFGMKDAKTPCSSATMLSSSHRFPASTVSDRWKHIQR